MLSKVPQILLIHVRKGMKHFISNTYLFSQYIAVFPIQGGYQHESGTILCAIRELSSIEMT